MALIVSGTTLRSISFLLNPPPLPSAEVRTNHFAANAWVISATIARFMSITVLSTACSTAQNYWAAVRLNSTHERAVNVQLELSMVLS